jgi:hypothetical protein
VFVEVPEAAERKQMLMAELTSVGAKQRPAMAEKNYES